MLLQVLHGTTNILTGGVAEVESAHQMVRLFLFNRRFSAVEIGDQREITGLCEPVGYAANLVVQTPPLLNHDDGGCTLEVLRLGEISLDVLAVRAAKGDHGSWGLFYATVLGCEEGVAWGL